MPASTFHFRSRWRSTKLRIERTGGQLDHYYHFIMDLVWPLHHWATTREPGVLPDVVRSDDPKPLYFDGHFRSLLGPRLVAMRNAAHWMERLLPTEHVVLRGFNSRVRDHEKTFAGLEEYRRAHQAFVAHVAARAHDGPTSPTPRVIVIDRSASADDRGASRRRIDDPAALLATLDRHCRARSVELLAVRMEDLGPLEQVQLVRSAPTILVGQHGAGLLNGLWMHTMHGGVIELAAEDNPAHFGNLYSDLGIAYHRLNFPARGAYGEQQVLVPEAGPVIERIDALLG